MNISVKSATTEIPLGRGVTVVQSHASGLFAFNKPVSVRAHPNSAKADERALLNCNYNQDLQFYHWVLPDGREEKLYLLNRLDSPTSGLIIGALSLELAEKVKKRFANKEVEKIYLAVVFRGHDLRRETWRDQLMVVKENEKLRTRTDSSQGEHALTHVRRIHLSTGRFKCALMELQPVTGRTHQLRVQCAKRRLPIVGDSTYGDFKLNRELRKATGCKRLFLHASHIRIPLNDAEQREYFEAESPMPAEFNTLLNES